MHMRIKHGLDCALNGKERLYCYELEWADENRESRELLAVAEPEILVGNYCITSRHDFLFDPSRLILHGTCVDIRAI